MEYKYYSKKGLKLTLQHPQIKQFIDDNSNLNFVEMFKTIISIPEQYNYTLEPERISDFINLFLNMQNNYTPNCYVIVKYTGNQWWFIRDRFHVGSGAGTININNTCIYNTKEEAEFELDSGLRDNIYDYEQNNVEIEILGLIR